MAQWYVNSVIVSTIVTAAALVFSSMSGFALAKYRFKGRNVIFAAVLAAMMFPPFLFLIPNFFIMKIWPLAGGNNLLGQGGSGLLGTYAAIILPFVGSWFGVFMMRQFMVTVPDEYMDSARIDGCSEFRIFWQIVLPMVKPALATLAVFAFIAQWNEFIWTMTVTRVNPDIQTIPVGIQLMRDTFNPTRTLALRRAALAVSTVPVMIVFLALQKYYVRGLVMSGIKG